MEALGAGANVLAVVVFGMKSAAFIYEILNAVKDRPRDMSSAAQDVLRLHSLLDRLSRSSAALNDDNCSSSLRSHLRSCAKDLGAYADMIRKLQIGPADGVHKVAWKKVQFLLDEKSLTRMAARLNNHTASLTLCLSAEQSEVAISTRDSLSEVQQITDSTKQLAERHVIAQESTLKSVRRQGLTLSDVRDDISQLRSDYGSIKDAVTAIPAVSTSQADLMVQMLKELQSQVSALSLSSSPKSSADLADSNDPKGSPTSPKAMDLQITPNLDDTLSESISELCQLVNSKERTIRVYEEEDMDEAERIIAALQSILDATKELSAIAGEGNVASEVRRFSRTFAASSEIAVNHTALQLPYSRGQLIRQARKIQKIQSRLGTLTFIANTRRRQSEHFSEHGSGSDDFYGNLTFIPSDPKKLYMIGASVGQRTMMGIHGWLRIPRLQINHVVSARSLVFDLVRRGQLKSLQELVATGKASLRDHDYSGASLLFYATRQPEVCRYLLENGADVDHVANVKHVWDTGLEREGSVLDVEWTDSGLSEDDLKNINECRRMLLEAGADPTISVASEARSYLRNISRQGNLESIQMTWNIGSVLARGELNESSGFQGRTILLEAVARYYFSRNVVSFLLDKGEDIHARDASGATCLHLCLSYLSGDGPAEQGDFSREIEEQQTLMLLVKRGADVRARDKSGRTVSSVAYGTRKSGYWATQRRNSEDNATLLTYDDFPSSYAGDLWDSVLVATGYDLVEFRKDCPRRPLYNQLYTSQHFEALWAGRETQCPYWGYKFPDETPEEPRTSRAEELGTQRVDPDDDGLDPW